MTSNNTKVHIKKRLEEQVQHLNVFCYKGFI